MQAIVIYRSKTGFTKRYAQWIAEELGCKAADDRAIRHLDLDGFDFVIYGGGVHAGRIAGLSRIKKQFQNRKSMLIVFATGATPFEAADEIEKMMQNNFADNTIPHFYMPSGLCFEKIGAVDKAVMKAFAKMLSKKNNKSAVEKGTASAISESYDISDKRYIKPLIQKLMEIPGGRAVNNYE